MNRKKPAGIPPAPKRVRQTTWRQFLKAHWNGLIAADFFTTEVLSWQGLVTYYTLFVIHLRSRLVKVYGTTVSPEWCRNSSTLNLWTSAISEARKKLRR